MTPEQANTLRELNQLTSEIRNEVIKTLPQSEGDIMTAHARAALIRFRKDRSLPVTEGDELFYSCYLEIHDVAIIGDQP